MKKKIYGIVTMLLGIASIVVACSTTSEVRAKSGWPSVEGRVLERHLESGRRPWRREPRVVYTFTVDGKSFKNDQVFMIPHTEGEEAEMRNLVDSEIPDAPKVFYDPDDPSQSYLLPNAKFWFYIMVPVGILMILIGLVVAVGAKPNEPVRGT